MNNPLEMTAAYFEGKLNADQVAELEAYLREDPARAKAFVRQAMLDSHLSDLLHESNVQDIAEDLSGDSPFGALLPAPAAPKAEDTDNDLPPVHLKSSDAVSKQQYLSALSYVARHTFTPKRIAVFATAAALLLGVLLAIVLMGGPDAGEPIVEQPGTSIEQPSPLPVLKTHATVATLTAEHDAVWDQKPGSDHHPGALRPDTLRPGDQLAAGQQLTLTQGLAEITTNRGAIAILEAPCVIELIDSPNALRLHAGKLVGICETESSKGFIVQTDYADITDLGTEFGVEVNANQLTATVFTGEIAVKPLGSSSKLLTANQTARVNKNGSTIDLVLSDAVGAGFTRRIPRDPVVTDARINLPGRRVEVLVQGVQEDVLRFTDVRAELNGLTPAGLPAALLGGDLVQVPNLARPRIAKGVNKLELELDLSGPADIYLVLHEKEPVHDWITEHYARTEMRVGIDSERDADMSLGTGPAVSIDDEASVWKYKQDARGTVVVGYSTKINMYSIIVQPKQ